MLLVFSDYQQATVVGMEAIPGNEQLRRVKN